MGIEYLIFFYMIISILMAIFDFVFLFYERHRDKSFKQKAEKMSEVLSSEIERNAEFPTEEHIQSIRKKMQWLSGLESFDLTMEKLENDSPEKSRRYLLGITGVFEYLARYFSTKSDLHKAYYSYIVRRWYRLRPASKNMITVLLKYVNEGSLYARQNALEALAEVGDPKALVAALVSIENFVDFHHPKLITEVAMAFSGANRALAEELSQRFGEFRPHMQAAIVNFMRMKKQGDPDFYFQRLQDENENNEVRLACMRYFMQHHDDRAKPLLEKMALSEDAGQWEYAAVAATVLGSYIDESSIRTLVTCLSSPIWYVRFNAAKSLYDAGLTLDGPELHPVMEGGDRYAQEMLHYRWEIETEVRKSKPEEEDLSSVETLDESGTLDEPVDAEHPINALPWIMGRSSAILSDSQTK